MATEINLLTQNNEAINCFDPLDQHDDIHFQSDWRLWDLQTIQTTRQNNDQYFNFEIFDSIGAISNHNDYLSYEIPESNIVSGNKNTFEKDNSENLAKSPDGQDTGIAADLSENSWLISNALSPTNQSFADSLTARLLTCNTKEYEVSERPIDDRPQTSEGVKIEHGNTQVNNEENKCEVCFAKAGRHNYYGGNVCTSCRGFFRRSVQSKQYPLFVCNANASNNVPITQSSLATISQGVFSAYTLCTIDSKSRKSCKRCRFLRCTRCGMRPGWVLSDEDRMRRMLQRSSKRNQLSVKKQLTFHFTHEETQLVEKLKSTIFAEAYSAYYQTFGEDLEIFRSYVNAIYFRQPIQYRVIKKIENIDKKAMVEKGFHLLDTILDVSKIQTNLKQALVRHNYVALFGFYWAVFCEACDMEEFMSEFMSYGLNHRNDPGVESLLEEMGKLNIRDKKSAWAYDMIYFSPWAPCADIEERHLKLSRRICMWPRIITDGENKIDRSQLAILTMILLLSKDGIKLESNLENMVHLRAAEDNQTKFVTMLHRYLKDKYPNDETLVNTSLANGLMIVSQAKELHEMHSLMLPI